MKRILGTILLLLLTTFNVLNAQENKKIHKIVIQVSSSDIITQKMALNNAVNLQEHYGVDNIKIEIVAYGPGLSLLTSESLQSTKVENLVFNDIKFSACSNTIEIMEKRFNKEIKLLDDVAIVPAGAARIMELQEQGYAYLRP
ncbi:DsrE family protein [Poseidonibacter lekithochrous]|uniref:DsrE family protein n=1 Tax=Poseidonibacter lekithochrous TaxID=1904463 RepID=UPI0008FCCF8C|nr:DsrE family protein [Poseidonibacter lekithochrous]QKJ22742.1 intracellular sulfur oxidation protein, DsrE/DsrF family [Poseidonibacter lekithochrous]